MAMDESWMLFCRRLESCKRHDSCQAKKRKRRAGDVNSPVTVRIAAGGFRPMGLKFSGILSTDG